METALLQEGAAGCCFLHSTLKLLGKLEVEVRVSVSGVPAGGLGLSEDLGICICDGVEKSGCHGLSFEEGEALRFLGWRELGVEEGSEELLFVGCEWSPGGEVGILVWDVVGAREAGMSGMMVPEFFRVSI